MLVQNGADIDLSPESISQLYESSGKSEAIKIVRKHLTKLKVLNLVKDDIFVKWRYPTTLLSRFAMTYKVEAERMREVICLQRKIKFVDILTKHIRTKLTFFWALMTL